MKTKILLVLALVSIMILNACSPFMIFSSTGEQPVPVEESIPATGYQPIDGVQIEEGHNLIPIEHVGVQAGEGSPIPVEIVASGTWPDLCAQIAEVKSKVDGFRIDITVLASTVEACPPDPLGLPFRFALPLNIVEMPEGTYTITVNGTSTTFDLPLSQYREEGLPRAVIVTSSPGHGSKVSSWRQRYRQERC